MMERFADASAQIQRSIDQIRESTESVNSAVEEVVKGVSTAAEKSVEMSDNMSKIDVDAANSNDISNQLKTEVGKFKLE